ncbi:ADP-ribosylation factor-like protein 6-interacting protein 1 [Patiria miniata]|uniref:RETREG1-3/ARL6IP-like N-terminal reticulon-homology domain-containing protein n=1 Tax=Patiria miniata TaxID=46514 RepID=A0A914ANM0_PATMI|nr:ADP-ribosylation factor-like protein 6-interacting protein 1 [Patiria miniata]
MAQVGAANSESKDEEITSLEQSLHEWRYILLHADGWLRWERENQPLIMAAAVTVFFTMLWWLEPSVLTTLSLLVMLICLADYLGPTVFHSYLCPPTEWTAEHQRQYQQVCISLLRTKDSVVNGYQWLKNMKEEKPKQYFILVVVVLAVIAFIGNLIPNLCLAYFLAVFLVLLPGLQQRGLLAQAYAASLQVVVNLLKQTKKKD